MNLRALLSALSLSIVATCANAQDAPSRYRPANFPADQTPIVSKLDFPEQEQDVLVRVFCQSYVLPSVRISNRYCLSAQPDDAPFRDAIIRRIIGTDIDPASIGGRPVPVYLQYTVQVQQHEGGETIELLRPHFY